MHGGKREIFKAQPCAHTKITVDHLGRSAFFYIRQSTVRQVIENTESTHPQYGLRQRAINLGWSEDQVVVIDDDLGKSTASGSERGGFQRLVAEVGMDRAGIVMGLRYHGLPAIVASGISCWRFVA